MHASSHVSALCLSSVGLVVACAGPPCGWSWFLTHCSELETILDLANSGITSMERTRSALEESLNGVKRLVKDKQEHE